MARAPGHDAALADALSKPLADAARLTIDGMRLWAVCASSIRAIVADDVHLALLEIDSAGRGGSRAIGLEHLVEIQVRPTALGVSIVAFIDDATTFGVDLAPSELEAALQSATVLTLLSHNARHSLGGRPPPAWGSAKRRTNEPGPRPIRLNRS